ncbi:MAG: ABC transporter ATP-binding protein [Leptospiraceae bacterium]|nr:ABC transporter ATP-binding protein [Leptospiraceae bacterium]
MLILKNVYKTYKNSEEVQVLKNINLEIPQGCFAVIMGPSGSGKSTLLGVAAGLDPIDKGQVILDGEDLTQKTEDELAELRAKKIGFIFQNFQLIPSLTAIENVSLPLIISKKIPEKQILDKAKFLLSKVGLEHRMHHFPRQLSGGEEQRVAIARAFANEPLLLFADEPTGNLDSKNSEMVMQMLSELNKSHGSTLLVVTHDVKVASLADVVYSMKDGEISFLEQKEETPRKVKRKKK